MKNHENQFIEEKPLNLIYPIGGFAPGSYMNKCRDCKERFIGDKLANQCKSCAINSINEGYKKISNELTILKNSLRLLKSAQEKINNLLD